MSAKGSRSRGSAVAARGRSSSKLGRIVYARDVPVEVRRAYEHRKEVRRDSFGIDGDFWEADRLPEDDDDMFAPDETEIQDSIAYTGITVSSLDRFAGVEPTVEELQNISETEDDVDDTELLGFHHLERSSGSSATAASDYQVWFDATVSSLERTFTSFRFPQGGRCDTICKEALDLIRKIRSGFFAKKEQDGGISEWETLHIFDLVELADRLEHEWDEADEFSVLSQEIEEMKLDGLEDKNLSEDLDKESPDEELF